MVSPLLSKAKNLPASSGCYLMKDREGGVLYVGKAKNLKARVSSYFQNSFQSVKTQHLVAKIFDFDFLLTETEAEAFVLENNLIKRHRPKYNIMLKDDKSYPYVVVDHNTPFPRLSFKRRVKRRPGREIFGPFARGSRIGDILRILTKTFGLRDCSLREFRSRKTPCLLFQMHQCSAPCVGYISEEEYRAELERALAFFHGEGEVVLQHLEEKMLHASELEAFERAALLRDSIFSLSAFMKSGGQKNVELHQHQKNLDVVAFYCGENEVDLSLYMVRNGILLGHKNFHFSLVHCESTEREAQEAYAQTQSANLLFQYYQQTHDTLPETLVAPFQKKTLAVFREALATLTKIKVCSPGRRFASLAELTLQHASEQQKVRVGRRESALEGLILLQRLLALKTRPRLIECYDVAIFQGASPTASQIVFRDGRPSKKDYRHYHLKIRPEGNNDFAMLSEVLNRRLEHGGLPDIFVVDGGRAQVNAFCAVLKEKDIEIPVVGIAKKKAEKKSVERLFLPGRQNAYPLKRQLPLLRLMTHMRDEAHRFARRLHHHAERKRLFKT